MLYCKQYMRLPKSHFLCLLWSSNERKLMAKEPAKESVENGTNKHPFYLPEYDISVEVESMEEAIQIAQNNQEKKGTL